MKLQPFKHHSYHVNSLIFQQIMELLKFKATQLLKQHLVIVISHQLNQHIVDLVSISQITATLLLVVVHLKNANQDMKEEQYIQRQDILH